HWCHVMEHESFEDAAIAAKLNEHFICIKVDREERPDLDSIYMMAVQMMTGRGGWPMSVFLTPDLQPFFGGTYWPPRARMGMPGFEQVISAVKDAWENRRDQAITQAAALTERIQQMSSQATGDGFTLASATLLHDAEAKLEQLFDGTYGGFGQAPKFPHAMDLQVLLRIWRRKRRPEILHMVQLTLDKMSQGGIYDHLGGGFARYSVDQQWLVPHFEKMLYDNALLTLAYLEAFQATGEPRYAQTVRETLDYVLRDLTDPHGGFHSTEDADSEGEEGKFYVWSRQEIIDVLNDDQLAERFCYIYDVTEQGNFEGHNILNLPKSLEQAAAAKGWDPIELASQMKAAKQKLFAVRSRRVRPGKDDKILVNWNGLMIDAMSRAAAILDEQRYMNAARLAAEFICDNMKQSNGQLLHCWRNGQARFQAYLDDYACLANGLVSLYEASFEERWIDEAHQLIETIRRHFADRDGRGFYYTSDDHEQLIARTKDIYDSSVPSGNAMAATVLLRLGTLCGRADFLEAARGVLDLAAPIMEQSPTAAGQMFIALDMVTGPTWELILVGSDQNDDVSAVLRDLHQRFIPNRVLAYRPDADQPDGSNELDAIFVGREAVDGRLSAYICRQFSCSRPAVGSDAIQRSWERIAQSEE
ncbi:MAG: thioredoxin domain-containing protein, partial [Planctomycetales bacterium]|nr:thioredoxin domain-containing protein [Planctomycetales bacterium]